MSNLHIHLTTHHLHLSDALREFVHKKLTPVKRFANDAVAADIVLRRHNGAKRRFSASARLALPGRDVHGRAMHVDLYVAIGQLVSTLARRLRKRKTRLGRLLERQYRPTRKARSPLLRPAFDETKAHASSTHAARKSYGGQELRVFPFRRRAVLMAASENVALRS